MSIRTPTFWFAAIHLAPPPRLQAKRVLLLASFASSLRALFLGFVVIPYWYVLRPSTTDPIGIYIYFAVWLGYFGLAGAQFYNGRRVWSWLRAALAALLAQLATIGLVALVSFLFSRDAA